MSRSRGGRSLTRSPPITRSPSVMSSSPAIIRNRVDFPQPDGPTRIMNSPSAISRLMSLTARNPSSYRLTMFLMLIAAIGVSPSRPGSALDGTGREAGHDSALEHQDDDHDGNGDH